MFNTKHSKNTRKVTIWNLYKRQNFRTSFVYSHTFSYKIQIQTALVEPGPALCNQLLEITLDDKLSGSPAKSGPLDFATRQSFPLFFVHEKGLVHMFKKCYNYFPILYFCVATS